MNNWEFEKQCKIISEFLREINYPYICHRVIPAQEINLFPSPEELNTVISVASEPFKLYFHFLRCGREVGREWAEKAFPTCFLDALVALDLAEINARDEYQLKGVCLISIHGLNLFISIHHQYRECRDHKVPVYLGIDSTWLVHGLPNQIKGTALDVCAGSGIQGLCLALRGANKVVLLEKNPNVIPFTKINVGINNFFHICEVRESDLFSALEDHEDFDMIVSNPPFMPVLEEIPFPIPGAGGADGTGLLKKILQTIPKRLKPDGKAIIICNALGNRELPNINRTVLPLLAKESGVDVRCFIHDQSDILNWKQTLERLLSETCPEIDHGLYDSLWNKWDSHLTIERIDHDYMFAQLIQIQNNGGETVFNMILFDANFADPFTFMMKKRRRVFA